MTSIAIGDELKQFAKAHACKIRILEREELRKLGLNLLLAVGQASQLSPSRLILVEYRPTRADPILLVGKGITFDTGGINIKAHENLVNCMKNDMGGAALMAHLFMTLVTSGYKKPLILAIPCCENLVGEGAMKPGAVIQSHKGKSVVIEHTDAEGRLILADAISYANDQYRPRLTFSAATLTTAALRQFSGYFTPVHFLGQEYQANLHAAGERWGERFSCWDEFLPFAAGNHTKLADLTNMGRLPSHASMGGGSNVAAHFLKEFCDSPLVHFDIFASTWNWSGDYPGTKSGATGAPFNTMLDFLAGF
jgi:leucyl aminopeptidase